MRKLPIENQKFYSSLQTRVQHYLNENGIAEVHYSELLYLVKSTAEEFGHNYKDLSIFGTFDSLLKISDESLTEGMQQEELPKPLKKVLAFDRQKVNK